MSKKKEEPSDKPASKDLWPTDRDRRQVDQAKLRLKKKYGKDEIAAMRRLTKPERTFNQVERQAIAELAGEQK